MKRKLLVTDEIKQKEIEKTLYDIYLILRNNSNFYSWGVLNGFSGVLLFLVCLYKFFQKNEILNDIYSTVAILSNNLYKIKTPTICDGFSGICWLLRYIHEEGIVESDDINETLEEIDSYIIKLFHEQYINDIDFLHGGLGIAYYLLLSETESGLNACEKYLDKLDESKIIQIDGSFMWTTQVENNGQLTTVANFSLSHGMASLIIFLSKYYERTNAQKAKLLLLKTIEFYKNNTNPDTYYSVYGSWLNIDSPTLLSESRLAWCYGDMGIAVALIYASSILNDDSLFDFSTRVIDKTTLRFSNSQINDAIFCHGSSGVSYIYNFFYQITGRDNYKQAALYWLDETLNRINQCHLDGSFELNSQLNDTYSILNGLSGVGLTLISSVNKQKENWSEILLFL